MAKINIALLIGIQFNSKDRIPQQIFKVIACIHKTSNKRDVDAYRAVVIVGSAMDRRLEFGLKLSFFWPTLLSFQMKHWEWMVLH